jgi:hypothetical protein
MAEQDLITVARGVVEAFNRSDWGGVQGRHDRGLRLR